MDEYKKIIEGMLFTNGEPLEADKICEILSIDKKDCFKILEELKDQYASEERGFVIKQIKNKFQLVSNPKYYDSYKKLFESIQRQSLSQAALEVLAIIAYKQPITKSKMEEIRGVNCEKVIVRLIEKNLIEEIGKLDTIGKPIVYGTTDGFLKMFNLENLSQLPPIDDFHKLVETSE